MSSPAPRPRSAASAAALTWRRRSALPLSALHHLLGHALGTALLPLLLHQLLKLGLARVEASLIGGAACHRLQHGHRQSRGALPDLTPRPVGGLRTDPNPSLATERNQNHRIISHHAPGRAKGRRETLVEQVSSH